MLRDMMRAFRAGLREAMDWPMFSWLRPSLRVFVLQPDGVTLVVQGAKIQGRGVQYARGRFSALLMPPEYVLTKRMSFPDLPSDRIQQALALEIASESPFPAKDTVWGWRLEIRSDDGVVVTLALTSRQRVESLLKQAHGGQGTLPEIWAEAEPPLPLLGYGEGLRSVAERQLGWLLVGALVVVVGLGSLLLATPFLQLRAQAIDAQQQMAELHSQTAEVVAQRDELARLHARAEGVQAVLDGQVDLLEVLEALAVALPDSVYLHSVNMQDSLVRMTGRGPKASTLVDQLAAHDQIRELRPISPITGVGDGTEEFGVEFQYVPVATWAGSRS